MSNYIYEPHIENVIKAHLMEKNGKKRITKFIESEFQIFSKDWEYTNQEHLLHAIESDRVFGHAQFIKWNGSRYRFRCLNVLANMADDFERLFEGKWNEGYEKYAPDFIEKNLKEIGLPLELHHEIIKTTQKIYESLVKYSNCKDIQILEKADQLEHSSFCSGLLKNLRMNLEMIAHKSNLQSSSNFVQIYRTERVSIV